MKSAFLVCAFLAAFILAEGRYFKNDQLLQEIADKLQQRQDTLETSSEEERESNTDLKQRGDAPETESDKAREFDDDDLEITEETLNGPAVSRNERNYITKRSAAVYTDYKCLHPDGTSETHSVKDGSLKAHNELRAKHNVPALTWDETLAADSQAWAEQMANDLKMYHSAGGSYGENLAYKALSMGDVFYSPAVLTNAWYDEIVDPQPYDFNSNAAQHAGHMTQLLWKSSKKVGCGVARIVDGSWNRVYYCCRYTPPGNYAGQYTANVPPAAVNDRAKTSETEINGLCDYFTKCKKYKSYCSMLGAACPETCGAD